MVGGRVRPSAVRGVFYDADPRRLRRQVEGCFVHPLGPGRVPAAWGARRIVGLVVPHAALEYSGPVAAHAYLRLAEASRPEAIVVIGPDHRGAGPGVALSPDERWEGPLGEVPTEHPVREDLRRRGIPLDARGHRHEHSVEVQLPFLQFIGYDGPVVPIVMADQDAATVRHLSQALAAAVADGNVVMIASTDLSHYLPHEHAVRTDRIALEALVSGDGERLLREVRACGITMCGAGPVAAVLEAARRLGPARVEILRYCTSGDVAGGSDAVVGYAAATIETKQRGLGAAGSEER